MSPLQRLVLGRMRERGWDPKTVEERGPVTHATLHRYMNPVVLKQLPRQDVLRSLAAGLDLTYEDVRDAAMASIDWAAGKSPALGYLARGVEGLAALDTEDLLAERRRIELERRLRQAAADNPARNA